MWIAVHDHSPVVPRAAARLSHPAPRERLRLAARRPPGADIEVNRRPEGGKTISVLVPLRDADAA